MRTFCLPLLLALVGAPFELEARERTKSVPPTNSVRTVEVATNRIKLGDIVVGLGELGETDLGPAPAPGVARLLTREEVIALLESQSIEAVNGVPEAVRVTRKLDTLKSEELRNLAAEAVELSGLRQGVQLKSMQVPSTLKVATGWETVTANVPKAPRHPGAWTTSVVLEFDAAGLRVGRLSIPMSFEISPSGALPDVSKGDLVVLVVKSGLVEVSTRATAGDNADIGDTFPLTLRPSGKVVRARLVSRDHAVLEGSMP